MLPPILANVGLRGLNLISGSHRNACFRMHSVLHQATPVGALSAPKASTVAVRDVR